MAPIRLEVSKQFYSTSSLVVGYALCSSLLAVINKFAITKFNYPGLLTALQYLTSALGVWVLGKLGFLNHDPFVYDTAKKFLPAAVVFYLAIFTNTNLLRHANIDTFIVFRSLTPLLVAIADTAFRKQPCPSKLTFLSLVIILGGAVGYVATDSGFTLTAYSWAFAYLITITSEMVYIKHMVMNLGLNTWGFVFYNNLLSLMMAPLFWIVTGEYVDVFAAVGSRSENWFKFDAFSAVLLSCVFGLLISFFGFAARKAISATAFTVTGVVNKFLTVLINVLIWDKHAGPFGLVCLLLTVGGGVLYQQSVTGAASTAPSQRDSAASKLIDSVNDDGDDKGEEDEEKGISGGMGKTVCTGAKSEQQSKLAARKYPRINQKLGFPAKFKNEPKLFPGLIYHMKQRKIELFPGLIYHMKQPKIVLLISISGKRLSLVEPR